MYDLRWLGLDWDGELVGNTQLRAKTPPTQNHPLEELKRQGVGLPLHLHTL